jgi:hypothetical protein
MRKTLAVLAASALISLCGCSQKAIIEKMAPEDVQRASEAAISDLRARRFDAVRKVLVEELRRQDHGADFARMADCFPDERPRAVMPVGFTFTTGTGGTSYNIGYEYQFSGGWVLAQFSWVRADGRLRISDFHVRSMTESLEERNAFTLRGKGALHYLVLLLWALAVAVTLAALVKCIRMRGLGHKWLWILFIIFGIGMLRLNWTTGEWSIGVLNIQIFSFSAVELFGSPWVVGVSVPVGAVVFLDKARRRRKAAEASAAQGAPPLL